MKITQVISDENVGGAGILLSLITEGLCKEFDFEILLPRASAAHSRGYRGCIPHGIALWTDGIFRPFIKSSTIG